MGKLWKKDGLRPFQDLFAVDTAFALIEGQPLLPHAVAGR
jgi:hypothetical protein